MIKMEVLYKPYSKHATLEETLEWIDKEAKGRGIDRLIMANAISEVFLEMHQGRKFAIDGGDTGFTHAHATMNVYLLNRMMKLHRNSMNVLRKTLENSLNNQIRKSKSRWTNWHKSPIATRIFKYGS